MAELDDGRLQALVGKMLGDLGGAMSVPTVRIGHRLGLFASLHRAGPATSEELASRTRLAARPVREWALAQAANGYIAYDGATDRFSLTPEQAFLFVQEDSPLFLQGAFDLAAAMVEAEAAVEATFRTGAGVAWGESGGCLFCAVGAFFRPTYVNSIAQSWLPALDGVVERLQAGIDVADIGCGVGLSTLIMAEAFPNSRFVGYDFHAPSIAEARAHAASHPAGAAVRFETAAAKSLPEGAFDLVTMFDCLHDMGDPLGAASHIRSRMKPDATWMIVEPLASDQAAANVESPVGRLYYNASTMICVPTSLAQEVGAALGAQAGEGRIRSVLADAGFTHVRRATEGPFNMVLEARP